MRTQGTQDVARSDSVETSPPAELLKLEQMLQMLNDVGVVDIAHVEAIKLAMSEGRFQVDSDVVADKLLQTVREYLPREEQKG
jgi:negative regulator of flagellin synthesis FlgM